MFYTPPPAS